MDTICQLLVCERKMPKFKNISSSKILIYVSAFFSHFWWIQNLRNLSLNLFAVALDVPAGGSVGYSEREPLGSGSRCPVLYPNENWTHMAGISAKGTTTQLHQHLRMLPVWPVNTTRPLYMICSLVIYEYLRKSSDCFPYKRLAGAQ